MRDRTRKKCHNKNNMTENCLVKDFLVQTGKRLHQLEWYLNNCQTVEETRMARDFLLTLHQQVQRILDQSENRLLMAEWGRAKALGHVGGGRFKAKL